MDYTQLAEFLRDNGYTVEKYYNEYKVTGKGIYGYLEDYRIGLDHERAFNKMWQCPVLLALPKNVKQAESLLKMLEFLATDEAYEKSNSFEYLENSPFYYSNKRWK